MNARARSITAAIVLAGAASAAGCGDVVRQGRSPSFLVIDSLTAASGARAGTFGTQLESDVQTLVNQTIDGKQVRVPTILEDLGQVTLHITLKDQGAPGAVAAPSPINQVTINRYHVHYVRADGRNTQGVDVPYDFDGAFTVTVGDTAVSAAFILVRIQSKEEAPLRALINQGGRNSILAIAEVTFYGRDQAGNEVQQTGSINVNFADWADPS